MRYPKINLDIRNPFKNQREVGTVHRLKALHIGQNSLIFSLFCSSFDFHLWKSIFTYVIDELNVIIMFLLLPRLNTLGKWIV